DADFLIVRGSNPNTLTRPEVPFARMGYQLTGWNTCPDPGVCENPKGYKPGAEYIVTTGNAQTLYAQWQELTATLAYEAAPRDTGTVRGPETSPKARFTEEVPQVSGTAEGATAAPASEGYTFLGWYLDNTFLTSDTRLVPRKDAGSGLWAARTYVARFIPVTFDVKFILTLPDGSQRVTNRVVAYREPAAAPEVPVFAGFSFSGWDKDFSSITANLEVFGSYTGRRHTVEFFGWQGVLLKTETVAHGSAAHAPAVPAVSRWHFTGWDKDFSDVRSDLKVYAGFAVGDDPDPTPSTTPEPTFSPSAAGPSAGPSATPTDLDPVDPTPVTTSTTQPPETPEPSPALSGTADPSPSASASPRARELPVTGTDPGLGAATGAMLISVGAAALAVSRRRG
ncbi:MAG: InlB B-repeat-containing protein, partial [Propionibacteriaceae bacterium]|nr:InlB B-repeat-containing protein [Propionibacteriaceae bacterium]